VEVCREQFDLVLPSMQIDRWSRNFVSSVVTTDLVKLFPCVIGWLLYIVLPFYGELKFLNNWNRKQKSRNWSHITTCLVLVLLILVGASQTGGQTDGQTDDSMMPIADHTVHLRGRGFESHQDRSGVITLSKYLVILATQILSRCQRTLRGEVVVRLAGA